MGKKVAILQSNYIPWKGYFDIMNLSDEFIILDDVQFTKNDWRNRNRIKTPTGSAWITIPVKHNFGQRIRDVRVATSNWASKHWRSIAMNYAKAPCFDEVGSKLESFYNGNLPELLSEINLEAMKLINEILGIETKLTLSRDYHLADGRNERLIEILRQSGASEYISGPAAKAYMDIKLFEESGIKVTWMDYSNYLEHPQLFPPFDHEVSIIDLILNTGKRAPTFMKSFRTVTSETESAK